MLRKIKDVTRKILNRIPNPKLEKEAREASNLAKRHAHTLKYQVRKTEELTEANNRLIKRNKSYRAILRESGIEVSFNDDDIPTVTGGLEPRNVGHGVIGRELPEVIKQPWEDKSYPLVNALIPLAAMAGDGVTVVGSFTEECGENDIRSTKFTITNNAGDKHVSVQKSIPSA